MKLRVTRRKPLFDAEGGGPLPAFEKPSDATPEEKRERLYRAIERAQSAMHKRESPEAVMASVRRWFPEPLYFMEASRRSMAKTGMSQMDAFYYSMIVDLTRTSLSQQWGDAPRLGALSRMAEYLQTLYVGVHVECFYLILLNRQGRLIRPVLLQKGAVDSAPFYLGQVLTAALDGSARHIVLAHNHPGGTRSPSQEDLHCTLRVLNAVAPLSIPLLDHIIVVPDGAVSIRETGMIPEFLWRGVGCDDRLSREWLDVELLTDRNDT